MNRSSNEPLTINVNNLERVESMSQTDTEYNRRKDIFNSIIPNIKDEIKDLIKDEKFYARFSGFCDIVKYILLLSVPIFALSSGQFKDYSEILSYISGACSIGAIGLERTSKNLNNISKMKNRKVNQILDSFGVKYNKTDIICSEEGLISPKTK